MKNNVLLIIFLIQSVLSLNAATENFLPQEKMRSTVKINVYSGGHLYTATGFVFYDNYHVVTSLHVMKPGNASVVVEYQGIKKQAFIEKVLPKADLVLLRINGTPPAWTYISERQLGQSIDFDADLYALGYNSGAPRAATKKLSKGFHETNKLRGLVPLKDKEILESIGIPHIDLEIVYLEGSLLPGYSGAPIFDTKGLLVGVGDGGLENGASNVSWGIPSRFLQELMQSIDNQLPQGLGQVNNLFSAEFIIELQVLSPSDTIVELSNPKSLQKEFVMGDFDFVYTKTRTFKQLKETADNPQRIEELVAEYEPYYINLDEIEFDVYEEFNSGIIIVVPKGMNFEQDANDPNLFSVDMEDEGYVVLYYTRILEEKGEMLNLDKEIEKILLEESIYAVMTDKDNLVTTNGQLGTYQFWGYLDEAKTELGMYCYAKDMITEKYGLTALTVIGVDNSLVELAGQCGTVNCTTIDSENECDLLCYYQRLGAKLEASIDLNTFANAKVIATDPFINYTWDSHNLSFSVPADAVVTSNISTEFVAKNDDIVFEIYPRDVSFLNGGTYEKMVLDWAAQNELNITDNGVMHFSDLNGFSGSNADFTINDKNIYLMVARHPSREDLIFCIWVEYANHELDTVIEMIKNIQEY